MSGEIQSISWQLDEDGGGEAKWFIDHLSHVDQHKRTFDSLDELPAQIAAAIRSLSTPMRHLGETIREQSPV